MLVGCHDDMGEAGAVERGECDENWKEPQPIVQYDASGDADDDKEQV